MGREHGDCVPSSSIQSFTHGILYPALCVIGIVLLARRIRHHRQRKYQLPERRQESLRPLSPAEKSGGDMSAGQGAAAPCIRDPSHNALTTTAATSSFPSACDILQPLSQLTPLPSSGHLAAILGRAKRQEHPANEKPGGGPGGESGASAGPSSDHSRPSTSETQASDLSGGGSDQSSYSGIGDSLPPMAPTPTEWRPVGSLAGNYSSHDGYFDGSELSGESAGPQPPVQKSRQVVQLLHDADEEGVRTWRRLMVEYS
ncbi:hypothetical protein BDW42DRAFT_176626 [Aspergillus taichungensis]|uniref:Uncharacterized protein n=1 Tax=Aspergillus taichungensis TaxID=482145 RepID=A0A2J5HKB0_9EURO|nr:hypothetical protein BDW42DRAFT_176626 [Aspergillus taichungensis]